MDYSDSKAWPMTAYGIDSVSWFNKINCLLIDSHFYFLKKHFKDQGKHLLKDPFIGLKDCWINSMIWGCVAKSIGNLFILIKNKLLNYLFNTFAWAPALNRIETISKWFLTAALWRGVFPFLKKQSESFYYTSLMLIVAPSSINAATLL